MPETGRDRSASSFQEGGQASVTVKVGVVTVGLGLVVVGEQTAPREGDDVVREGVPITGLHP